MASSCRSSKSRSTDSNSTEPSRSIATASTAPGEEPEQQADGVDRDVDRRGVAAADEVLVDLVRRRVREPNSKRGSSRPSARKSRIAEDRVLGHVRALAEDRVPTPRPVPRLGIDEKREDDRRPEDDREPERETREEASSAADDRLARQGRAAREPGAIPGRSRRCEGRRSAPRRHWPRAGKAAREGAPSQKTCRSPPTRTPRGRRIRATATLVVRRRRRVVVAALVPAALAVGVHVRVEGKTQTIFGATEPSLDRQGRTRSTRSTRPACAGEFYYHVTTTVVRPVRRPDRPLRGRRLRPAGSSRSTASRRRWAPTTSPLKDGDRVLWYWAHVRLDRRPADARAPSTTKRELLPRARPGRPGQDEAGAGRRLHVGAPAASSRRSRQPRAVGRTRGSCARRSKARCARTRCGEAISPLRGPRRSRCAGCGGTGGAGHATLWVTRDRGRTVLLVATVPAGLTALAGASTAWRS